jgi:acetyl-CoA carboxylase biotin carboxyl carrier protein
MIDIRKLKELVRLMVTNDLTELDVRDEQEQVSIKRPNPHGATYAQPLVTVAPAVAPAPVATAPTAPAAAAPAAPAPAAADPAAPVADGVETIESPMVGTFFAASGPGKPPFVQVGSKVGPDSILCLIEAMKIFNEIKAERSGTIEAILVKNGQAVEFGQPLFRIRPD